MAGRTFDWQGFLSLAEELGVRQDEASLRSALSRSYYFVYHQALDRALNNGYRARSGDSSHAQLWQLFEASPDPDCRRLGVLGSRLREIRNRADYEPTFSRINEQTPRCLSDAKQFAENLRKLPQRFPKV